MGQGPNSSSDRHDIVAASTRVDLRLYQDIYEAFQAASAEFSNTTGGAMQMSLQPLTSQAVMEGQKRGGNALGFSLISQNCKPVPTQLLTLPLPSDPCYKLQLTACSVFTAVVSWTLDVHDHFAHDTIVRLGQTVSDLAKSRNLSLPHLNPNDATFSQDPLHSFGATSLTRLKAVSAKYDPEGVFQTQQDGGFLLSHSR